MDRRTGRRSCDPVVRLPRQLQPVDDCGLLVPRHCRGACVVGRDGGRRAAGRPRRRDARVLGDRRPCAPPEAGRPPGLRPGGAIFVMAAPYLRRLLIEYGGDLAVKSYLFADPFTRPVSFADREYAVIDPTWDHRAACDLCVDHAWMRDRVAQIDEALHGQGRPLVPAADYLDLLAEVDPKGPDRSTVPRWRPRSGLPAPRSAQLRGVAHTRAVRAHRGKPRTEHPRQDRLTSRTELTRWHLQQPMH